jgi:hypothetical protein
MENIDIFFLIFSAIFAYQTTKDIFTIRKTSIQQSEARRFFEQMSENDKNTNDQEFRKIGLALAKKKGEEKYTLIPQTKLTDLSLS